MAVPTVSPRTFRRITAVVLFAMTLIVVTGGAVRLTGSGLGCSDWPNCHEDQFVPARGFHDWVEFGNRLVTGLISIPVLLAIVGALRRRPYRRDLLWWSVAIAAGIFAQALVGAVVVWMELTPSTVMVHFLLSMVVIWCAVVLYERARQPATEPVPAVPAEVRTMSRLLVASTMLVLFVGTLVTGSGPHGGDPDVERLPFDVPDVVRLHSIAAWLTVAAALVTTVMARRAGGARVLVDRGHQLLVVLVLQGVIGYAQYFNGVPVGLVALHLLGASLVWIAVVRFHLALVVRPEEGRADLSAPAAATASG
ncbi:MAG: COX15/CtaA family protein [Acidimicrobiales bacterium]|nr:COX15/CtaA family protein [Acidimicrobiales bacterium]